MAVKYQGGVILCADSSNFHHNLRNLRRWSLHCWQSCWQDWLCPRPHLCAQKWSRRTIPTNCPQSATPHWLTQHRAGKAASRSHRRQNVPKDQLWKTAGDRLHRRRMGSLQRPSSVLSEFGRSDSWARLHNGRLWQWIHLRILWRTLQAEHDLWVGEELLHIGSVTGYEKRRELRRYYQVDKHYWEGNGERVPHLWKPSLQVVLMMYWCDAVIIWDE